VVILAAIHVDMNERGAPAHKVRYAFAQIEQCSAL
jgi:hypothetical protein